MTAEREGPVAAPRRTIAMAAFALLIAAGLWVSLHYSLGTWKADPDIFVTVELWRGIHRYGPSFAASWAYTQDNWLLSVIPPAALLYEAFGATARNAVLLGWLFFIASVGLTAWLAHRIAGVLVGVATAAVLLFANAQLLGSVGYLSYPISHNASMAWGLLALGFAYASLERRSLLFAAGSVAAVFVDVISDPWATPAIAVPLALASGVLAVVHLRTRLSACAAALSLGAAISAWIAHRHPFGLFSFLLNDAFQRGGVATAMANLRLGLQALGTMFNLVAGASLDAAGAQFLSAAILALLLIVSAIVVFIRLRRLAAPQQLVFGVSVLSLGAIAVLYVIGQPATGLNAGRFFPNAYFLGALLVVLAIAAVVGVWRRRLVMAAAVYAALLGVAGAVSAPRLWTSRLPSAESADALRLGQFLKAHGLTYGYGGFWGSRALTMETLTHGEVTIRPVSLLTGRITRRRQETSAAWYTPEAEPAARPLFLFIIGDGEECAVLSQCEEIARRQFGAPTSVLPYDGGEVMVWNHPLARLIDPMPR